MPTTASPIPGTLHLPGHIETPPGGYAYKITALAERAPKIAWVTGFHTFFDLSNEVRKRCLANGIVPPSESEIEDQVCQRQPPGYCRDSLGQPSRRPGSMAVSLAEVVSGTKALARWFLHGSVEEGEIVRRSRICNECPENRPIAGCSGCAASQLHKVMNAIVVKPLPSDAVLHACSICKCSLKAKVRMRVDDVLPQMPADQVARLPDKCWLIAAPAAQDIDPRV